MDGLCSSKKTNNFLRFFETMAHSPHLLFLSVTNCLSCLTFYLELYFCFITGSNTVLTFHSIIDFKIVFIEWAKRIKMKADSKRKTKTQSKKEAWVKKTYDKISSMTWKTSRAVANKSKPNINDWVGKQHPVRVTQWTKDVHLGKRRLQLGTPVILSDLEQRALLFES